MCVKDLRVFSLLHGSYHHITGKTALGILITATYVGQAVAVAGGLKLVFSNKSMEGLGLILLTIGLLVVLRGLLHWLDEIYARRIALLVKSRLRERLFQYILQNLRRRVSAKAKVLFRPAGAQPFLLRPAAVILSAGIFVGGTSVLSRQPPAGSLR